MQIKIRREAIGNVEWSTVPGHQETRVSADLQDWRSIGQALLGPIATMPCGVPVRAGEE